MVILLEKLQTKLAFRETRGQGRGGENAALERQWEWELCGGRRQNQVGEDIALLLGLITLDLYSSAPQHASSTTGQNFKAWRAGRLYQG